MRKNLKQFVDSTNGKIFSVQFRKRDGSMREMTCRTKVTKYLKGGESTVADKEHLATVYDVQAKGYRCINLDTVTKVKYAGEEYVIEEGL